MDDHPAPTREPDARPRAPQVILGLQVVVAVILVGWALRATASVSALIAAALFAAVILAPLDRWVATRTGQGWLGHTAALLAMIASFLAFLAGLYFAAQRVATEFPSLEQMSTGMIPGVEGGSEDGQGGEGSGILDSLLGGGESSGVEVVSRLADIASSVALTGLEYASAAVGGVVVLIFLALIMLVDAPHWRARVERVWGDRVAGGAEDAVAVIGRQLLLFILARTALGLLAAVLYMAWLWAFGVELLLVWGVLTLLLSFVPNFGSILSGILPTLYAFLTKDFGTAIAVGIGLTVIEQVIGNYVDPRVQGRLVSISPTVILTALLIFAWVWGVPGALLSTPVLIAAVIAFSRIDALRPTALLLSNCRTFEELDEVARV